MNILTGNVIGRRTNRLAVCILMVAISTAVLASPEEDHTKGVKEYNAQNLIEAMTLLRRSAEAGYAPAQATLGFILDGAEENAEALSWYKKAADQGNPDGQFGLAKMYGSGEATGKADQKLAFEWMSKAAEHGYTQAIRVLVEAYEKGGLGQTADNAKVVQWLTRAAEAGDKNSIERIADAHRTGKFGLPADEAEAARWDAKLTTK